MAKALRFFLFLGVTLVSAGCADPEPRADQVVVVAPDADPPPAKEQALSKQGVVERAKSGADPADINRDLDQFPFDFDLDDPTLKWFADQELPPDVLDYLEKRSKIDWEAARGDIGSFEPK